MMVYLDKAYNKCKYIHMNGRACVQIILDANGKDTNIYSKILNAYHNLLVNLAALENGINTDIGTLKRDRGCVFIILHGNIQSKIPAVYKISVI